MAPYEIIEPSIEPIPIVISAPHSGTAFPSEVIQAYKPEIIEDPIDADWFVDELYRFAGELGITVIKARYSRYVVDLNRPEKAVNLYDDGRQETTVVPKTTFLGQPLYKAQYPIDAEIERRLAAYHRPYYEKIEKLLGDLQKRHSHVLLYDAHSIKRNVPSISSRPFPDLTLGTNCGNAADERLINVATQNLGSAGYGLAVDKIFKGGQITRTFGQPNRGRHALQLERAWDIYLKEDRSGLDEQKYKQLGPLLQKNILALAEMLYKMNNE